MACPLCKSPGPTEFYRDKHRPYFLCSICELVFVPPEFHISEDSEKGYYAKHRNSPDHEGYRKFLSRAVIPLIEVIAKRGSLNGLDFGCGSAPTLHLMMQELGHKMVLYDKYYFPDPEVWKTEYEFITATSVVGHLANCGDELNRLWNHIRPGGYLVVMTKRVESLERFAQWHYRTDPTHIMFYHINTFEWLRRKWGVREMIVSGADVVIFVKA